MPSLPRKTENASDDGSARSNTNGSAAINGGFAVRQRKDALFRHPVPHYEAVFGYKVRALRYWIATGRAAMPPELPPLDQPERMVGWWIRHMGSRCCVPDRILAIAIASRAMPSTRAFGGSVAREDGSQSSPQ